MAYGQGVATDIEKLKARLAKAEAAAHKAARQKQALESKLSKAARAADAHLKIVLGVWAMGKAESDPDFKAAMLRDLNRTLWRDDERTALGLEKLPPDIQEQRKPKRPSPVPAKGPSPALADGFGSAPPANAQANTAPEVPQAAQ
jgi:hypothetical protein